MTYITLLSFSYSFLFHSGFDKCSDREVFLRDTRRLDKVVNRTSFGCANGILIPIYDRSKDVLFLAAKSDTSIYHVGVPKNILLAWHRYQGKTQSYTVWWFRRKIDFEMNRNSFCSMCFNYRKSTEGCLLGRLPNAQPRRNCKNLSVDTNWHRTHLFSYNVEIQSSRRHK